jgi:hypothetical protein
VQILMCRDKLRPFNEPLSHRIRLISKHGGYLLDICLVAKKWIEHFWVLYHLSSCSTFLKASVSSTPLNVVLSKITPEPRRAAEKTIINKMRNRYRNEHCVPGRRTEEWRPWGHQHEMTPKGSSVPCGRRRQRCDRQLNNIICWKSLYCLS